jgi:hypothetical protein
MSLNPIYRICVDTGSSLRIIDALTKELLCEIPEEKHEKSKIRASTEAIYWSLFQKGFLKKIVQIHPITFHQEKIIPLPEKITQVKTTKDKLLLAGRMSGILVYDLRSMIQTGTLEATRTLVKKIHLKADPALKMDFLLTIIDENKEIRHLKLRSSATRIEKAPFIFFPVSCNDGFTNPLATLAYFIESPLMP